MKVWWFEDFCGWALLGNGDDALHDAWDANLKHSEGADVEAMYFCYFVSL